MKKNSLAAMAVIAAGSLALVSCSEAPFLGDWESSPAPISNPLPQQATGTAVTGLTFLKAEDNTAGKTTFSQEYDIKHTTVTAEGMTFDVHVTGTATASGTWTYDVDDDDDLLLTFDDASVSVDISGTELTYRGDQDSLLVTAAQDSLQRSLSTEWNRSIEDLFRRDLVRYGVISDIERARDKNTITFEIENPEQKIVMRRIAK